MHERVSVPSAVAQPVSAARAGGGVARTRALLAEDHALLRRALRQLLERQAEIEVVGDVGDGFAAVDAAERTRPDVVLMDLAMPGMGGIEATRQITERLRGVRVLMLTGHEYDERIVQALRAGATGYLLKNADLDELLLAIRAVRTGNPYFSAAITADRSAIELPIRARLMQKLGARHLADLVRHALRTGILIEPDDRDGPAAAPL